MLIKPKKFEQAGFTFWYRRKNILFENDAVKIIIWFPYQSFHQTQFQNNSSLLFFKISPVNYWRKTFDPFSEWDGLRFQISLAYRGRGRIYWALHYKMHFETDLSKKQWWRLNKAWRKQTIVKGNIKIVSENPKLLSPVWNVCRFGKQTNNI